MAPREPTAKKEQTHEQIVKIAARALRRGGSEGVVVAEVMKEAGLTHGGFYAHFDSKNALLAEAAERAAVDSLSQFRKAIQQRPDTVTALESLLSNYLSERHLQAPERGCMLVAVGSELARESPEVRRVATEQIRELIDLVHRQMPGWESGADKARAMATLAGMVGAMIVARAVDDPALASAMLKATAQQLAREPGT